MPWAGTRATPAHAAQRGSLARPRREYSCSSYAGVSSARGGTPALLRGAAICGLETDLCVPYESRVSATAIAPSARPRVYGIPRQAVTMGPQEIGRYFGVRVPQDLERPPSWNIRSTEDVLGIVGARGGPALRLMDWGMLIPVASEVKPKPVLDGRPVYSDMQYISCANCYYSYPKVGSCVVRRTSRWWTQTRWLQGKIKQHPTVIRRLRMATRRPLKRTRSPAIRNLPRGLANWIAAPRGATTQPIFAISKLALA